MRFTEAQKCARYFGMMQIVHDIETRAAEVGVPVRDLCQAAGVSISTFNRWKAGTVGPTWRKLQALNAELDRCQRGENTAA